MSIADLAVEIRRSILVEELEALGLAYEKLAGSPNTFDPFVPTWDGMDAVRIRVTPHLQAFLFNPATNQTECECCQSAPIQLFPRYFERINHVSG